MVGTVDRRWVEWIVVEALLGSPSVAEQGSSLRLKHKGTVSRLVMDWKVLELGWNGVVERIEHWPEDGDSFGQEFRMEEWAVLEHW